jgi:hypothetical protein
MTDDARLRSAYDELLAARAPADRVGCPAPEALLRVVDREGDETSRLATLDHVLTCSWCRPELDMLRASADAASMVAPASSASSLGMRRLPLRALAMAAGIVVVIGVGVVVRDQGDQARGTLRGNGSAITLGIPERRADGALLLRWSRVTDATRYRVELFTVSGATVAQAVVSETTYVVRPDTTAGATRPLNWMVTAITADGAERSSPMGRIPP